VVGHVGIAGAALAATFVSPALADYFIVQDATTKRCTRQEDRTKVISSNGLPDKHPASRFNLQP
jgi:hypothetical protein